jgi:hypothetical protein
MRSLIFAAFFLLSTSDKDGIPAFELDCGDTIFVVAPATAPRLDELKDLALCLGPAHQHVCTVDAIRVRKPGK